MGNVAKIKMLRVYKFCGAVRCTLFFFSLFFRLPFPDIITSTRSIIHTEKSRWRLLWLEYHFGMYRIDCQYIQ